MRWDALPDFVFGLFRSLCLVLCTQYAWKTKRAELLLLQPTQGVSPEALQARFDEARVAWRELMLSYSTENYHLHRGYMCALLELDPATCARVLALKALDLAPSAVPLNASQRSVLASAYTALAELKPRSRAVMRIPLTFLEPGSPEHADALLAYVLKMVKDGMPALAADLSGLYTEWQDGDGLGGGDEVSSWVPGEGEGATR
jgi:hypothetical protein